MIPNIRPGLTAIVCGTGPSITQDQIELVNGFYWCKSGIVIGCNRAYQIFEVDIIHGCNYQFWDYWWKEDPEIRSNRYRRYTTRPELEGKYPGLEYIQEVWIPGLSRDPTCIAAHHGTGPQAVNIAYLMGATRIVLVGWDMRFPGKVDNRTYREPRRYLGEDPLTLNHWPRTEADGSLGGLIAEMETIHPGDYGIEIINATPNSAMTCFPMMELKDAIATP